MSTEPAITTYGQIHPQAPSQLSLFSFLVGKQNGLCKTRMPDGSEAQFESTWIGRYILDGMAIADELEHYRTPDPDHFTYITELSHDAGQSWDPAAFEMTMTRAA